jgi:hypothetical protein
MLQVFHLYVAKVDLDVAYVLQWLHACFKYFQVFCKCFRHMLASVSVVFGCMLQAFHLNVVKVNLVLHMLQWDPSPATAARAPGLPCEPLRLVDASTVHIHRRGRRLPQPTWAQTAWEAEQGRTVSTWMHVETERRRWSPHETGLPHMLGRAAGAGVRTRVYVRMSGR